jgi:hypothetical protein
LVNAKHFLLGADWPEEQHGPGGDDSHEEQFGRPRGHGDENAGM